MAEKTIPNEKTIIEEIPRRRGTQKRNPSEKMQIFKGRIGAEIERTGTLRQAFVDELLRQIKNAPLLPRGK